MDMIERVARATFHAECEPHQEETGYGSVWGWLDVMPSVRERHLSIARAAIGAMLEPTEAMIEAGVTADHGKTLGERVTNCHTAMISAALSPSGERHG